jgi:hypothetical protein
VAQRSFSALQSGESFPVLPVHVRESQKVERLVLSSSLFVPSSVQYILPELDPARFIWMQFQLKLSQLFPKVF